MAATTDELATSSGIAKAIGISDAKVKKAIKDLAIEPAAKKGPCNYYAKDAVAKIKNHVKIANT
jgi:hypothetical protein